MVTKRHQKSKGNQFEYDVQYNLEKCFDRVTRTSERGFQQQYDLLAEEFFALSGVSVSYTAVECKFERTITWNQAEKYLEKLRLAAEGKNPILVFKTNQQPVLCMFYDNHHPTIMKFEDYFGVKFEKHPPTRANYG